MPMGIIEMVLRPGVKVIGNSSTVSFGTLVSVSVCMNAVWWRHSFRQCGVKSPLLFIAVELMIALACMNSVNVLPQT